MFLCITAANAEDNYCLDAETNAHWESIVERAHYANDQDVIGLYNLRVSLCEQVEKGELTVKEATKLFEVERDRVVDGLQKEDV